MGQRDPMRSTSPRSSRRAVRSVGLAVVAAAIAAGLAAAVPAPAAADPAPVDTTERLTWSPAGSGGGVGDGGQIARALVSQDGRYVVFASSTVYDPADTNGSDRDTYLRDRQTGAITLVGVTGSEVALSTGSTPCGMSANGQYVGFTSVAPELGGVAGRRHVYRRDRFAGTTTRVSVSSAELVANADSTDCDVSGDGAVVAYTSEATNLVAADTNARDDVFVRYVAAGTTVRASVSSAEAQSSSSSFEPSLDSDGSVLAFTSFSQDLVAGTDAAPDVFVRNLAAGTTTLVSRATGAAGPVSDDESRQPDVSGDGSVVAFRSLGTNLVTGDTNGVNDVFVRDLGANTTVRANRSSVGGQSLDGTSERPSINLAGTKVAYESTANNAGAAGRQVYVRTLATAVPELVSKTASGGAPDGDSTYPALSGDGTVVTFHSAAKNMVRSDISIGRDVYARAFDLSFAPFGFAADPIDAFIRRQHLDFVGRQPTTAERSEAHAVLRNGEENPDMFIDRFAHAPAWAEHRAPVARLYWAFFLRIPEDGGFTYWVDRRRAGKSLSFIASNFAASSEFQNTYGSLGNAAFVTKIYQNIFDREPDAGGQAYWTNQLATGAKTRGDVMVAFSESSEGRRYLAPPTDTVLVNRGMLGAMPSDLVAAIFIDQLRAGISIEDLIRNVRLGPVYEDRVEP